MAVNRAAVVDRKFQDLVGSLPAPGAVRTDLDAPVRDGTTLTARTALALFEAQVESRTLDMLARELKASGRSFYTIGSAGHEGNAAVAGALRPTDPAFLHYRSGAFFLARAQQVPGPAGAFDVLLGLTASADEPIAGGRHKVFGSVPLCIPPQTSTIASHLPKAMGAAIAMDRRARWEDRREDRIVVCTFGDASANHATALAGLNSAAWATHQRIPCPALFVCEDNGLGISVRTPLRWIHDSFAERHGLAYFAADGLDLPNAWDAARAAAQFVRSHRKPAFLHLKVARLLGHAGSDVEQLYRTRLEIEEGEALDPLLRTAELLISEGWTTPGAVLDLYARTRARLTALADEAGRRPLLTTAQQVMAPLFTHDAQAVAAGVPVASEDARSAWFRELPECSERPRHMALQLNRALADVLLAAPEAVCFGEDVGRKGGVYHVTADLSTRFGVGRVFNTLLDETSILGLAIGAAHEGLLPIPEVQYLAYLMNAIDQLRGEAGSLQFFSQGQYSNGMVVRVAGLAYQKGFGGHFHNDHGIAALREIPGLLLGCPARGDDAARMLRTMVSAARVHGRLCVLLEPIARYMTKDLHEDGDGAWLTAYPPPHEHLPVGAIEVYGDGTDVCIATWANGLWMSLRVARRLGERGVRCRVVDLRWLQPLPLDALVPQVEATGRLVVVDECRRSSGIADAVAAEVAERVPGVRIRRVVAPDSYIPLGAAADLVLVSEDAIEAALLEVL